MEFLATMLGAALGVIAAGGHVFDNKQTTLAHDHPRADQHVKIALVLEAVEFIPAAEGMIARN